MVVTPTQDEESIFSSLTIPIHCGDRKLSIIEYSTPDKKTTLCHHVNTIVCSCIAESVSVRSVIRPAWSRRFFKILDRVSVPVG